MKVCLVRSSIKTPSLQVGTSRGSRAVSRQAADLQQYPRLQPALLLRTLVLECRLTNARRRLTNTPHESSRRSSVVPRSLSRLVRAPFACSSCRVCEFLLLNDVKSLKTSSCQKLMTSCLHAQRQSAAQAQPIKDFYKRRQEYEAKCSETWTKRWVTEFWFRTCSAVLCCDICAL